MPIQVHLSAMLRGYEYDEPLSLPDACEPPATCKGLPEGLHFDQVRLSLQGNPTRSGRFPLSFLGKDGDLIAEATLVVHEGTESLWEALEPPADGPCPSVHAISESITGAHARAWAASKRGRQHARLAGFREDAFCMATQGAWTLLAVADGAGSCSLSREGASVAVQAAVASLQGSLGGFSDQAAFEQILPSAFEAASAALSERAEALKEAPKALSTTLSVLCHHLGPEGHTFAALGIGDSPIVILDAEGQPQVLHTPDEGDFSGETHFLPAPPPSGFASTLAARVQVLRLPAFQSAYLMTDGIHDPFFETQRGLLAPERWRNFLESLAPVQNAQAHKRADALLDWLDFWSRGNHDDRTLIILQAHEPH